LQDDGQDTYMQEHEKSEYLWVVCFAWSRWSWQGGWPLEMVEGKPSFTSMFFVPTRTYPHPHQNHKCDFPIISRSVEQLFSKSWHLCTDLQGSLKAEMVTEAMCVRRWLQDGLYKLIW
jgi:hypothetical protein